jgi:hypothetical protein
VCDVEVEGGNENVWGDVTVMSWLSCDCHPMHTGNCGGGRGSKGRRNGGSSGEKTTRGVRPIGHANRTH